MAAGVLPPMSTRRYPEQYRWPSGPSKFARGISTGSGRLSGSNGIWRAWRVSGCWAARGGEPGAVAGVGFEVPDRVGRGQVGEVRALRVEAVEHLAGGRLAFGEGLVKVGGVRLAPRVGRAGRCRPVEPVGGDRLRNG